jgi:peptide/nickel transport system substrate-binding protein
MLPSPQPEPALVTPTLSRRRFVLRSLGGALATGVLAACAPAALPASTPAPTRAAAATSAPAATTAPTAAAAAAGGAPTPLPHTGGTLVVVSNSEPGPLEPSLNPGLDTSRYINDVYDRLIDLNLAVDAPIPPLMPSLATEWSVSSDGLQYMFKLRNGVTFHDGTPFDAEAAKFNIDRLTQPDSQFYFEKGAGSTKIVYGRVGSVTVVDPMTISVQLSQPYANFTDALSLPTASFGSPTAFKTYGNDNYPAHPAGTGPFKFQEQQQGTRLVLAANSSYWGGAPPLDQVLVRPVSEPTAAVSALQAGEVQLITGVPADLLDTLRSRPEFSVKLANVPQTYCWNFNMKEPPFTDKRVRQALNYAVDRDTYANTIMKGLAKPATSVFGPGMAGYDPSLNGYAYDPDKARQLLKDAGLEQGFAFKVQTAKAQGMDQIALYVKDNLAKIGVTVDVELFDFPTMLANANKTGTTPGVGAIGWSWNCDPPFNFDRFFTSSFGPPNGVNFGFYSNPMVDQTLSQISKTIDRDERLKLYRMLDGIVTEDAAWLFLYHPIDPRVSVSKLNWTSANSSIYTLRKAVLTS